MTMNRRGGIFDSFEREFDEMNRMMDRMFSGFRSWDWTRVPTNEPLYYGVSVDVGPDGVPHVEQFGNLRPGEAEPLESGVREPFTTTMVDDDHGQVRVTAEMPGIAKEDIDVEATKDSLIIRADGNDRRYRKTVPLRTPVEEDSASATYNNGVLEVTLGIEKPEPPKGKHVDIK